MQNRNRADQGFSLLEAVIVVGIVMVLGGLAVFQSLGSLQNYQVNSAQDAVVSQLRLARQLAISQRRYVRVQINTATTPASVTYTILPRAGSGDLPSAPVMAVLPDQTKFMQESGVPDTPMAFGTCSSAGVCIGGVAGGPPFMQFTSTGQFVDSTGVTTLNGTIFIGVPNKKPTARAITIMGGTGRVRPYTYVGGSTVWAQ